MTNIKLDAATLAQLRNVRGDVTFCDESGTPVVQRVILPAFPLDSEPDLTDEERQAIENEPGSMSTPEVLAHLQQLECT